ncbi:MAG: type I glutamate--ammonia ligase, partial [Lachnospiraceae bacterium]|nr:type I glutamate--ammonia ligase [Lachnospiraceae bacterium]
RSPDCLANPYLAFALLIEACLYGIEEQPMLMKSTDVDLFTADNKSLPRLKTLPLSITEAQNQAKRSDFVKQVLPASVIEAYLQ